MAPVLGQAPGAWNSTIVASGVWWQLVV